jgi:A/G-specific adenine glycosylase
MRPVDNAIVPARDIGEFRRSLLAWFAERKRDLPWRRSKDPYPIWISEIMLQQTRVATVIPYFERFIERFPKVGDLARARSEAVLSHWAGLGYYSRAKNLHLAAKQMVTQHGGRFPRNHDLALALPGIGIYTAAAVLSIAYDQPLAVLDGNVARVLARIGALRGDLRAPSRWRELAASAQNLLAVETPGDWNQAMMELGATVCTPKSPSCDECPVAHWCRARTLGIADQVPESRQRPVAVQVVLAAAVLLDRRGRTLLVRQNSADGALFSRMWQFPAIETTGNAAKDLSAYLRENFGVKPAKRATEAGSMTPIRTARHTVTFRNIRLEPFVIHVAQLPQIAGARSPRLERLAQMPISNATRKIADAAIAHESRH